MITAQIKMTITEYIRIVDHAILNTVFESTVQHVNKCAVRTTSLNTTRHIHNILLTAPQLSISQKALGMFPEGGKAMPKHVAATIHN
jgi:hypothetical protein